jgi:hypothetical protein
MEAFAPMISPQVALKTAPASVSFGVRGPISQIDSRQVWW